MRLAQTPPILNSAVTDQGSLLLRQRRRPPVREDALGVFQGRLSRKRLFRRLLRGYRGLARTPSKPLAEGRRRADNLRDVPPRILDPSGRRRSCRSPDRSLVDLLRHRPRHVAPAGRTRAGLLLAVLAARPPMERRSARNRPCACLAPWTWRRVAAEEAKGDVAEPSRLAEDRRARTSRRG
jgi:hypothetical protein